jgi:hypothetical protein
LTAREHTGSVNGSLISLKVILAAPPLLSGCVAFVERLDATRRKLISVAEGGQQSNDDRNKATSGHKKPRLVSSRRDGTATSIPIITAETEAVKCGD